MKRYPLKPPSSRLARAARPTFFPAAAAMALVAVAGFVLPVTAQSSQATSVHVASIEVTTTSKAHGFWSKSFTATVDVLILDDLGNPVSGAVVTGTFSGSALKREFTVSGVTGSDGTVTFDKKGSFLRDGNDRVVIFCVSDVSASLPYNPADNSTSCAVGNIPW